jgi:hypothetical protein
MYMKTDIIYGTHLVEIRIVVYDVSISCVDPNNFLNCQEMFLKKV